MRTVLISDLHLGLRAGSDVARRPELRPRLLEIVSGADRLVLLGDVLELRERSVEDALATARPLLRDLAGALGPGGEVVLVPGNHDYALAGAIFDSVGGPAGLRSLENRLEPAPSSALGRLAGELSSTRLELAYPGLWIADGVYAMHGHYGDVHSAVPTVECLAIAASARLTGGKPPPGSTPADYERLLGPVYRASRTIGRAGETIGRGDGGDFSIRVFERLNRSRQERGGRGGQPGGGSPGRAAERAGSGGGARGPDSGSPFDQLAERVLAGGLPAAVAAANRLGLGPFDADLSRRTLRRAGLRAVGAAVRRLGIDASYVVFGHTHRPGPLPGDVEEWTLPAGDGHPETRLINTGSWVYEPVFLSARPGESPYWPGRCVVVEDGRAPQLLHPLADAGHEELAGGR